jgi:hypothetical protein
MFIENAPFQFLQSRRGDIKTTPLSHRERTRVTVCSAGVPACEFTEPPGSVIAEFQLSNRCAKKHQFAHQIFLSRSASVPPVAQVSPPASLACVSQA